MRFVPRVAEPVQVAPSPQEIEPTDVPLAVPISNPWASVGSRELLERWLTAEDSEARGLERELRERGFGRLSTDMVRPLLDGDEQYRVQLVYDLLEIPGVDAKAWLALLADDESADVRFAAVSIMATSRDPDLLRKAWDVALHDRDPRVASLVEQMRTRREVANRR